jgi:hypothetical protein
MVLTYVWGGSRLEDIEAKKEKKMKMKKTLKIKAFS